MQKALIGCINQIGSDIAACISKKVLESNSTGCQMRIKHDPVLKVATVRISCSCYSILGWPRHRSMKESKIQSINQISGVIPGRISNEMPPTNLIGVDMGLKDNPVLEITTITVGRTGHGILRSSRHCPVQKTFVCCVNQRRGVVPAGITNQRLESNQVSS